MLQLYPRNLSAIKPSHYGALFPMRPTRETCWGLFLEVSSHIQGRLMQSSHGGEGGNTPCLYFLL
ncbi:hypothetical protein YC2023_059950 [Brassica napus]